MKTMAFKPNVEVQGKSNKHNKNTFWSLMRKVDKTIDPHFVFKSRIEARNYRKFIRSVDMYNIVKVSINKVVLDV